MAEGRQLFLQKNSIKYVWQSSKLYASDDDKQL